MCLCPPLGGITAEEKVEKVKDSIRDGFLGIDRHMQQLARNSGWDRSGSTAAAVMISPRNIYFINCGDSRTFLCRNGQVVFYTEDHKPCNPREKERIQNAGGSVTLQRINGSLAVSRALGDFTFKEVEWRTQTEQLVSPEPEIYDLERSPSDEFLVVACDGVWDAISNEELCAFVHNRLSVCDDLREVCSQVIDLCLYKVRVPTNGPKSPTKLVSRQGMFALNCYCDSIRSFTSFTDLLLIELVSIYQFIINL